MNEIIHRDLSYNSYTVQGNSQPVLNPVVSISSIRSELEQLRDSVPMFTSWMQPELKGVADKYAGILLSLAQQEPFRSTCRHLLKALPSVQQYVSEAAATPDWRSFNQAAALLRWDIDELIGILPA